MIEEHKERFTITVVELLSGKLSVADAEARAEGFNRHALRYDTMVMVDADTASAISDICNYWAKNGRPMRGPGALTSSGNAPGIDTCGKPISTTANDGASNCWRGEVTMDADK